MGRWVWVGWLCEAGRSIGRCDAAWMRGMGFEKNKRASVY